MPDALAQPDAGDAVHFIDPDGKIVEVDEAQAPAVAQVRGYQIASPKQIEDYELQKKYGGAGQQAVAGLEAAAGGATFGASSWLERAAGVSPEGMAGRQAANPATALVSGLAGAVAPAIMAPETAPTALVGKLGALLSGGAETALGVEGAAGVSRAARMAAATAAGWGAEGAAYSAGNVVHESALGDPNLTAQSAMAEIGLGSIIGGGIGALVGANIGMLPAALEKAKDAGERLYSGAKQTMSSVYRATSAATGVAKASSDILVENAVSFGTLEHAAPGIVKDLTGSTPEMVKWVASNTDKLAAAEQSFPGITKMLANGTDVEHAGFLLDNFDRMWRDTATRTSMASRMHEGLGGFYDSVQAASRESHKIVGEEAAQLIGSEGIDAHAAGAAYDSVYDMAAKTVSEMDARPAKFSGAMRETLRDLSDDLVGSAPSTPGETFQKLLDFKTQIEKRAFAKNTALATPEVSNTMDVLRDLAAKVRSITTDEAIFGSAAVRRAELNAARSEWLQLTGRGGEFNKAFLAQTGSKTGDAYKVAANKIDKHLGQIVRLQGAEDLDVWDRTVEAGKRLIEQIDKSSKTIAGDFDKASLDSLINKSSKATEDARLAATVTRGIREQNPAIPFGNGIAAPMLHAIEGAAHHVPFGGTIVSTVKAAMDVSAGVSVLSHLSHASTMISEKIDSAISTLVRSGVRSASVGRREVAAGIGAVFGHESADRTARANQRREQLDKLTADPEAFADAMQKHVAPIAEHAPSTAQALQVATARAAQFLASKAPRRPDQGGPLASEWAPAPADVAKFHRYQEAVDRPLSVLKMAAAGTLTPEHMEALRVVYPELLAKMQSSALERLTDPRLPPLAFRAKTGLGRLLGQDMTGLGHGPPMSKNQSSYRLQPSGGQSGAGGMRSASPGGAKSLSLSDRITPGTDRIATRSTR